MMEGKFDVFKCEIAIGDDVYSYSHDYPLDNKQTIAKVTLNKDLTYSIEHFISLSNENSISSEIYSLNTNEFHKVNLLCLSP